MLKIAVFIIVMLFATIAFSGCSMHVNTFGICGEAAQIVPLKAKHAGRWVKNKNTQALTRWLYSTPVKRAYAVSGLWALQRDNSQIIIPPKTIQRIDKIKNDSTTIIKTCGGCVIMRQSLKQALDYCTFN